MLQVPLKANLSSYYHWINVPPRFQIIQKNNLLTFSNLKDDFFRPYATLTDLRQLILQGNNINLVRFFTGGVASLYLSKKLTFTCIWLDKLRVLAVWKVSTLKKLKTDNWITQWDIHIVSSEIVNCTKLSLWLISIWWLSFGPARAATGSGRARAGLGSGSGLAIFGFQPVGPRKIWSGFCNLLLTLIA